ncbi:MAG TPA: CHAT domain-containing protein [Pyrinomonadaceae bacterium]|nr:CHAT domain-containing protein [Pyrinomonadaceae bacterium]
MSIIVCRPKSLPIEKLAAAERRAIEINPENARERRTVARTPIGRRGGQRRIAVVVARKWPSKGVRLSVSFLDTPPAALRTRIIRHMNAWGEHANVVFSETDGTGEVRIARLKEPPELSGYWSWVGTEIMEAEPDEPTMNLEGFTMKTSDAEFRRVVRHEAGHTLGFDHEHMRSEIVKMIDRKKAFAFFDRTEGWTKEEIEEQVLTPLAKKSIMGTEEVDPLSIMCYQLPGSIMKNGKAVKGGLDINPKDFAFAASLYPKPGVAPERQETKTTDVPATGLQTITERVVKTDVPVSTSTAFVPRVEEASETFELVVMDEFKSGGDPRRAGSTPKFAQVFASYCGARVTSVMRLRADKGEEKTRFGEIIRMHERIKAYTNREEGSLPDDDEMISFGGKLFDTLFQGDVRRLYDEARTRQRGRLDLVLTSMIPWIAEKPWEFSYDHGRKSFLATEEIHFIRNVLTNVPADPIVETDGPLRILVVSAQPVGFGRLSIEQELAVIQRGFEPLVEAGLVTIDTLARATPSMIHGRLTTGNYQIVHFIGHGIYNEELGEGCLMFVNEQGGEYPLGERSVREIFRGRGLSLVFLNACESGRGGAADFNKGVAQSLVAHGLPALVANQYSVLDSSATSFAQQFYWSLAQGMSLGRAAREARIAVNYLLHGEPIDWAVPVVYARDANATLCTRPATSMMIPATSVRASTRRSTIAHKSRVGVWDMDNVFPALNKTLERMNQTQKDFGFELVDLSVPLGVWDLDSERGTPYLWAEMLADRLQRMPMELGVELLVCVTRHWLRDDDWLGLYGWWPSDKRPPIIIFSIAGFEELSPEGPETDRAIANAMVTGLAGYYGEFESHDGRSTDCPMWFNEERDYQHLVSDQRFDASCRKKLKAKVGKTFGAFEALLKVFR